MQVLGKDTRMLLSWSEVMTGPKRMRAVIDDKEANNDFSVTHYRIELTPPHHWHGDNFIVLTHDPKNNRSMIF